LGADVLLMDEDTCATNFMIRDQKMIQLVSKEKEPITPFIHVVKSLYEQHNISTILVIGGTGDFLDVADRVLVMDTYQCEDATERARQIVEDTKKNMNDTTTATIESSVPFPPINHRYPIYHKMKCDDRVKVVGGKVIVFGKAIEVDLSMVEQIVSRNQISAIATILQNFSLRSKKRSYDPTVLHNTTLNELLKELDQLLNNSGFDAITKKSPTKNQEYDRHYHQQFNGSYMRPRKLEIGAAINRLRNCLCIEQQKTKLAEVEQSKFTVSSS
jgi:hypothetical protein